MCSVWKKLLPADMGLVFLPGNGGKFRVRETGSSVDPVGQKPFIAAVCSVALPSAFKNNNMKGKIVDDMQNIVVHVSLAKLGWVAAKVCAHINECLGQVVIDSLLQFNGGVYIMCLLPCTYLIFICLACHVS